MATPWWYTRYEGQNTSVCFIDGTCRNGFSVFKNNGKGQQVYDATMIMMIIAWLPFLAFFHLMLSRKRHAERFTGRRTAIIVTHLMSCLLILSSVITFSVGLVSVLNLGKLYGKAEVYYPPGYYYWGAHVGWYFAIFTLVLLVPALVFSLALHSTKKNIKKVTDDSSLLLPHTAKKPGYHAIPQTVTTL